MQRSSCLSSAPPACRQKEGRGRKEIRASPKKRRREEREGGEKKRQKTRHLPAQNISKEFCQSGTICRTKQIIGKTAPKNTNRTQRQTNQSSLPKILPKRAPDKKRIFQSAFGRAMPHKKGKPIGNTKFAPEIFIQKTHLTRREFFGQLSGEKRHIIKENVGKTTPRNTNRTQVLNKQKLAPANFSKMCTWQDENFLAACGRTMQHNDGERECPLSDTRVILSPGPRYSSLHHSNYFKWCPKGAQRAYAMQEKKQRQRQKRETEPDRQPQTNPTRKPLHTPTYPLARNSWGFTQKQQKAGSQTDPPLVHKNAH